MLIQNTIEGMTHSDLYVCEGMHAFKNFIFPVQQRISQQHIKHKYCHNTLSSAAGGPVFYGITYK